MSELFCERLRRLRKARGLKLKEIAYPLRVSVSQVAQWEAGRRRVYVEHVLPLACVLGVDVRELLTGEA